MAYFPFFIDIENKRCVVIGGGSVAKRKVEKLLPFKPAISVFAPKICDEIAQIPDLKIYRREFQDGDIDGAFMVISATDDEELNSHIFALCRDKNIPVNTVDDKDKCSFIFPALALYEATTVGISTSGKCPIYSRTLREKIEKTLVEDAGICDTLSRAREIIKAEVGSERNRKKALEHILNHCTQTGEDIDDNKILEIIEEYR